GHRIRHGRNRRRCEVPEVPRVFAVTIRGRPGHRPGDAAGDTPATSDRGSELVHTVTVCAMTGGRSSAVRGRTGGLRGGLCAATASVLGAAAAYPAQRRSPPAPDELAAR